MNFLALGASIYERTLTKSKWVTTEQSKMAMFGPTSGTTNFPVCWYSNHHQAYKNKIMREKIPVVLPTRLSNTIHVWYIYLHLVIFYGKCR